MRAEMSADPPGRPTNDHRQWFFREFRQGRADGKDARRCGGCSDPYEFQNA